LSDACKDGSTDYQAALRGDGGDVAEADRGQTGEHKVKGSEKVRQLRVAQVLGVVDQTIRYEEQGKHASYDASDLKNRGESQMLACQMTYNGTSQKERAIESKRCEIRAGHNNAMGAH